MTNLEKYISESARFQKTVVGYPLKGNKILLGLRKKVSLGLGQNLISGIGGKIEENETTKQALVREFTEEVKIQLTSYQERGQVTFIFPHKPKWNQVCTVYIIDTWRDEPTETEVIKPLWFEIDKLPKNQMWEDNLIWIPKVLHNKTVNGVFIYDENNHIVDIDLKRA